MNSPEAAIRLAAVEKSYWTGSVQEHVLRVDELELLSGQAVLVTGHNGSGKSTLLRVLANVSRVDAGEVWRSHDLRTAVVGYVPQHGGIYSDLTVAENLALRRRLAGRSASDPTNRSFVRTLDLVPLLGRRVSELSGGYEHLAAIAAALHSDPEFLVLDEPFSGIDHDNVDRLAEILSHVAGTARLLVVSAPDPQVPMRSDRTLTMENGAPR